MPDQTMASSGGFLSGTRANDVLAALQNGVQAINNAANTITTKISSIVTANPGGSSGQVQFNTGTGFGGFTLGGDATLVSSAGTLTIASHAVTYGKIQAESSGTLLGNLGTGSTSPAEQLSSQVTAFLTPFSSVVQGVVNPSSNSNSSAFYLGGDNAFHSAATSGMVFLGSVTTVSSQIVDTSTTTNLLAANNATYRSFKLIFKNIIPNTNAVTLALQVHSGGTFQTSSYVGFLFAAGPGGTGSTGLSTALSITFGGDISNAAPGLSGDATVSNLSGTTNNKNWFGATSYVKSSASNTITFLGGSWAGGNGAIDGFQITTSVGALSSGVVDVYGML